MEKIYINVGTSPDAMKAAIAAFEALGGKDATSMMTIRGDMKHALQSISMDQNKSISWASTQWFKMNNWKQVGDFSDLRIEPEFKVVEIVLTRDHIAEIHKDDTVVGCSVIPNNKILEVADQIRKNSGLK